MRKQVTHHMVQGQGRKVMELTCHPVEADLDLHLQWGPYPELGR